MNEDLSTNALANNKTAIDAYQAFAKIFLTSAERLAALNLSAAREVVDDQSTLARAMLGTRSPGEAGNVQSTLAQPMINRALAYSRGSYEILAETQSELSQLLVSQLPHMGGQLAMPDWNAAFDMFRAGARQFSDMAAQNVAATAEAATSVGAAARKKSA